MAEGHLVAAGGGGVGPDQDGGVLAFGADAFDQEAVGLVIVLHAVGDEGVVHRRGVEVDDEGAGAEAGLEGLGGFGAGGEVIDGAGDGAEGAAAGEGEGQRSGRRRVRMG